jgi:hypothetical protein
MPRYNQLDITFRTVNAAFGEEDDTGILENECAHILRDIAEQAEMGANSGAIMDSNGNKVGRWDLR